MFKRIATTAVAIGLSLSAVTAVSAESTPIFKAPIGAQDATKSKTFGINPELGRAWVEVTVYESVTELIDTYRVPVPGLRYDKDSSQVVYDAEGRNVVCANVRETGNWFFKDQRIEATGDCELTRRYVKVPIDDGFAVDVIEHFEVHFKPVERTGRLHQTTDKQG
ncbi:MAG: hypothetical protein Q7J29_01075 [Stagnimonas sp.]|nr:hypothetical protein [Stagnimonas sp.]